MIDWPAYTRIPLKAQLWERETWFREGLASAERAFADPGAMLWKTALVMIKADGLVSGRAPAIVRTLHDHELSIVAAETIVLTRFHWRELWRYQLTSATLDRLAINDLVLRDRALLLLLRHDGALDVPASVGLSARKGPSDLASQPPDCLRRVLAQPNRIFSFLHVADEPADLLREMAILLDEQTRDRIFAAVATGTLAPDDRRLVDNTLADSARNARPLDVTESLQRMSEAALRNGAASPAIHDALDRMRRGERISWRPFVDAIAEAGIEVEHWDLATLGASFIVYDEPGASKVIKGVDASLWRRQPS
jgi:hypothetical protein